MVFIHHKRWNEILQPKLARECRAAGCDSLDQYLNTSHHKFTPFGSFLGKDSMYGINLYFIYPEDEIIFRLKYDI